jgi:hypothetical protein
MIKGERMRAGLATIALLTPFLVVAEVRAQTPIPKKALPPTPVTKTAVPQATIPPPAAPQTSAPWKAILRVLPNPLPAGRCANASVEIQDGDGYRATTLSNGGVVDFHQFVYKSSDMTSFNWLDQNPVEATICAPATSTAAHTTITVTLPDGLVGSVDLTTVPPGQSATMVHYPPQGRLRPAGVASPLAAAPATAPAIAPLAAPPPATGNPAVGVERADTSASTGWAGSLTVDGSTTPIQLIRGGGAVGSVVTNNDGTKRLGNTSVEPIVLLTAPSATLVTWINSDWSGSPTVRDGAVLAQASSVAPSIAGHFAFTSGLITSTRLPELPTKGGGIIIAVAPERTAGTSAGAPKALVAPTPITDFRFVVSGISSGKVLKVASFAVEKAASRSGFVDAATQLQAARSPPVFPDIFVTIDESSAADWIAWYNDFLVNGNHLVANERTFTLDLLSSRSAAPIATVKAYGVGIVALRSNQVVGGPATLEAELYVGRMEIVAPGSK